MMQFQAAKASAEEAELKRQITAMEQGLKRIQAKIKPPHYYDAEMLQLKQGLRKETDSILELQSTHQKVVTACNKEMQEQDAIKCSENGKLTTRQAEKTQFCNAIEVRNQVLKQDLSKCSLLTGVGQPRGATGMPIGLAPPVALRDNE